MIIMPRKISNYSLRKSAEHLYYEVLMFYQTLTALTKQRNQIEVNILLDAFAIHTRNLFDFFYPKKNIRRDDMSVLDFVEKRRLFHQNKTRKKDLLFIVRKADKQVAHLTYSRNRYNQNNKGWAFIDIGNKMVKTLNSFYQSLPNNRKGWLHIQELKKVIDNYTQFLD